MAVNIGPKIGIDGEKEYRKQINDLITQQKTFSAQMKELESSFDDETSAMEKNRKKSELLEKQISNQEKQVEELEKGLKAASDAYGEDSAEANKWKQAVANGKTELNKMKKELDKIPKSLQQVGKDMQNAGKKISSFGSSFTKYVSAPVAALGGLSIAAFNEVDEGLDIVAVKTGATGEALDGLQTSVKNLAGEIPTDFATAGEAIGEVNTRFGLTGSELEDLSAKFVKFAELNNTDVSSSVDNVQKLMAAFGVETEDAGDVLDALNKVGQTTGISMDKLEASMIKNASALQNMGLDAYQAAGFIGQVEESGVSVETVMTGMSKALTEASKDGKTLPEVLSEFDAVMNSSASDQEKLNAAIALFGKKAGPAIYEACKQGSLSFETLSSDASDYLGSVETTFENTLDAPDKMKVALNNLKVAGAELGETMLDMLTPAIEDAGEMAKSVSTFFQNLTDDQKEAIVKIGAVVAVAGPAIMIVGTLVEKIGAVVEAFGAVPGAAAKVAGVALPVGVAIGAFALLKAGIDAAHEKAIDSVDGLREMLEGNASAVSDLNTATADLKKVMSDTADNIDDINSKAATASDLIDELYDLDAVTKKTAGQQAKMKSIVGQLNAMYPELGLAIDDTTGKLNKGKKECKNYVEEAKKIALLEAYTTGAKTAYTKLADANLALYNAQKQQKEGLDMLTTAYHNYYEAEKNAPVDSATKQHLYTQEVQDAKIAYEAAKDAQLELNGAVEDAKDAIAAAEEECAYYTEQQDALSSATEESTETTEEHTEAVSEETEAMKANTSAIAARTAQLVSDVSSAVSNIGKEVTAWDDLYEATKESIEGQLGLFDEWEQETDLTAGQILANLQSQTKWMKNYASNMGRLSAEAVKSSDPNFKAFVKSLNDMGIDGAAEVQLLVDTMDNDRETFNAIVAEFGGNRQEAIDNVAEIETYITSGFRTRTEAALTGVLIAANNLGKSPGFKQFKQNAQDALQNAGSKVKDHIAATKQAGEDIKKNLANGYQTLPFTAAQASTQAKNSTETTINGMKLMPTVSKISVPASVTSDAKKTAESGVNNLRGQLVKIDGAAAAGKTAGETASDHCKVKATLTVDNISSVAWDVKTRLQNWFASNPIIAAVKAAASASHHAEGGIVRHETLSWLAEGNKPEAVIPLAASQRSNALDLYAKAGQMLGVQRATVTPTTMTISNPTANGGAGASFNLDMEQMYSVVASAAKRGMESANIRIYWDNREAGRIMKNMGVQFV